MKICNNASNVQERRPIRMLDEMLCHTNINTLNLTLWAFKHPYPSVLLMAYLLSVTSVEPTINWSCVSSCMYDKSRLEFDCNLRNALAYFSER